MPGEQENEWIRTSGCGDSVEISVHLTPRAARDCVDRIQGGLLRIRLTSPPVEDAANRHLVEFLSRLTRIPKSNITVLSGKKSRIKRLSLSGCTREQILLALAPVRHEE